MLCVHSTACYGSPLYARMCIWDCAHHSPPQLNPPPAHICIGTESIPCPPLHRERVHPSPTSAPPLLPSGTSAFAQHRCGAVQCVATARAVLQHSATWARTIPFCGSIVTDRNSPEDTKSLISLTGLRRPARQTGSDRSQCHPCGLRVFYY